MSVTKSKTAEHDADIKDNSHERAKLEASLRPARARPRGISSAYSRSEPTGRPLARRVISILLAARSHRIVLPFRLCAGLFPVFRWIGRCR